MDPMNNIVPPVLTVYKISNGFLLQTVNDDTALTSVTYCANAIQIAEEIIASAARTKLDVAQQVPEQQEMFTPAQMGRDQRGKSI
jgi:hypothetical protein